LIVIFTAGYASIHTLYRSWRTKKDGDAVVRASDLPKGTL
jgi:hypothetical protein